MTEKPGTPCPPIDVEDSLRRWNTAGLHKPVKIVPRVYEQVTPAAERRAAAEEAKAKAVTPVKVKKVRRK